MPGDIPDVPPPPLPLPPRTTLRGIGADPTAHHVVSPVRDEDDRAPYILVARYRKARAIARSLTAMGGDAATVEQLGRTELGRKLAADRAGVNLPSETTWYLVVELVREVRP